MIPTVVRPPRWRALCFVLAVLPGCSFSGSGDDAPGFELPRTVPVDGVVTVKGKPVAGLVVTFLAQSGPSLGAGETDEEGRYEVYSMGQPGVPAGTYKVAISYLLSAEGVPQGVGPRSSLVPSRSLASAKEQLPPLYSDLGRTAYLAQVGAEGGHFDFDIPVDLPAPPSKKAEAAGEAPSAPPAAPSPTPAKVK